MILYDVVAHARTILIDTRIPYRWSDEFMERKFNEMVNILWTQKISLFLDELGRFNKQFYNITLPLERETLYNVGDLVHNFDNEIFECTISGTTDTIEPTYNLGYEALSVDGTATFMNLERQDLPFPDFTKIMLSAYLISRAYEIDSTDQNNAARTQEYQQIFQEIYS